MQAVCVYCPEMQAPQVAQDGALEEVEYDVPVTHAEHTASDVLVHALLNRVPAAQVVQDSCAVDPCGQ